MTRARFEAFFRDSYLPLCMYALRIVGDDTDAEDAVEDALLKTWQALAADRAIDNLKAYAYRAVRTSCADLLRRRVSTAPLEEIPEPDSEAVDTSERDARVWRAVDGLPPRCREIFLLSKRDGLAIAEIAARLDLSEKTVKNQLTKALSRLRGELAPGRRLFFLPFL